MKDSLPATLCGAKLAGPLPLIKGDSYRAAGTPFPLPIDKGDSYLIPVKSGRAGTKKTISPPFMKTLFQKIADREIPSEFVYEDEVCFAIRDINPQAPTHILVIPKRVIVRLSAADDSDAETLGYLLVTAGKIAAQLGLENGFRTVVNCGADAGETVPHLHVHLLGGRKLAWPPG